MLKRKPVVGIDIDGVLADLMNVLKSTAEEMLGKPAGSLPETTSWGFKEWGVDYPDLFPEAVRRNYLFRSCPPVQGSAEALSVLRERGWHLRIITHRGSTSERRWLKNLGRNKYWLRQETLQWLKAEHIPYDDIFFVEDKTSIDADIYIDDDPKNIERYSKCAKRSILFRQNYNAKESLPVGSQEAKTWSDVLKILESSGIAEHPRTVFKGTYTQNSPSF